MTLLVLEKECLWGISLRRKENPTPLLCLPWTPKELNLKLLVSRSSLKIWDPVGNLRSSPVWNAVFCNLSRGDSLQMMYLVFIFLLIFRIVFHGACLASNSFGTGGWPYTSDAPASDVLSAGIPVLCGGGEGLKSVMHSRQTFCQLGYIPSTSPLEIFWLLVTIRGKKKTTQKPSRIYWPALHGIDDLSRSGEYPQSALVEKTSLFYIREQISLSLQ